MKTKTVEALEFDSNDLETVKVLESFGMASAHARIYVAISGKIDNRAEIGSIAGVSQIQIAEYISKYSSLVNISAIAPEGAGRPSDRFKSVGNLENVLYALIKVREESFIVGKALFNSFLGIEYDTFEFVPSETPETPETPKATTETPETPETSKATTETPETPTTPDKAGKKGDKVKGA
jgi:hypothetical protein